MRMPRAFCAVFAVFFVGSLVLGGVACQDPNQAAMIMQHLQQGKAKGSLEINTNGQFGIEETAGIYLGPKATSLNFEGSIDYSGAQFDLDRVQAPAKTEEPDPPPGD